MRMLGQFYNSNKFFYLRNYFPSLIFIVMFDESIKNLKTSHVCNKLKEININIIFL